MFPRQFARIAGSLMILMGVLALIPAFSTFPDWMTPLNLNESYGYFMGLIPMNIVNKVILIALGSWGILAAADSTRGLPMSINWSRFIGGFGALMFILGIIPSSATLGGYVPLYGYDIGLHFVMGVLGAYFGFALRAKADLKIAPYVDKDDDFEDHRKVG
jgi:hypothetical protein